MVVFVVKRYAVREAKKWRYAVRNAKIERYAVRIGGRGVSPSFRGFRRQAEHIESVRSTQKSCYIIRRHQIIHIKGACLQRGHYYIVSS